MACLRGCTEFDGHIPRQLPGMTIRAATVSDVADLHAMIGELADYESLEMTATMADTEAALFAKPAAAEALIAIGFDGAPAGFAIYYPCYSTFRGGRVLYLEDLFVRDSFRRRGIGRALLAEFLGIARQRGCAKVEWRVLRWNTPAIEFYRSLGATILDDWVPVRLEFNP
ncbi:MAG: GNAT family N-acetyltransferase [Verrucomicrobiales bacterium]